ncbi:MAG: hypothetical protein LBL84_00135, partial [Candidatus Nomurabacteria bacterium]|nr:hypothetical protein [Candidatus Nomurabacteria bacterium]
MAQPKKNTRKNRRKVSTKQKLTPQNITFKQGVSDGYIRAKLRVHSHKLRRPHRSFRVTRRRDYKRSFKMPGYFAFTNQVWARIFKVKKTFALLVLFSVAAFALLVGALSQDTYTSLGEALRSEEHTSELQS